MVQYCETVSNLHIWQVRIYGAFSDSNQNRIWSTMNDALHEVTNCWKIKECFESSSNKASPSSTLRILS